MFFAITKDQHKEFGCAKCGCSCGHYFLYTENVGLWTCKTCHSTTVVTDKETYNFSELLCDEIITVAFNQHPCQTNLPSCCVTNIKELVQVDDVGRFVTPGCFISGGQEAEREGLVLRTTCRKAARHIEWMFEMGAVAQGQHIVVGADSIHIDRLNDLMWHIINTKEIDLSIIRANQVKEKALSNGYCREYSEQIS